MQCYFNWFQFLLESELNVLMIWGSVPYFLEPLMFSFGVYLQRFRHKILAVLVNFFHALFNYPYNRIC